MKKTKTSGHKKELPLRHKMQSTLYYCPHGGSVVLAVLMCVLDVMQWSQ